MRALLTPLFIAGLCSAASPRAAVRQAHAVFRPIAFEEALTTAAEEGRLVLASFVIEGSDECRRMAEKTWADPAVARWLEVESVAVELDGEERADLVERLGIEEFPTVVVFASDGTEYDRMRGYTRPRSFIHAFTGLLEMRELIHAARLLVAESPEDPRARMELARALATGRGRASAAEQYEWVWTQVRSDPEFRHLRLVKVLTEMASLARQYKPARQRMLKWRRRALELLDTGELEQRLLAALEVSALNDHLAESEAMLRLYLSHRDSGKTPPELLDALFDERVVRQLYNQGRYDELLAGLRDPLVRVEELFAELDTLRVRLSSGYLAPEETGAVGVFESGLYAKSGIYFETLLLAGRKEEAIELKDYVVLRELVARSYVTMMRSARKARSAELARQIAQDGLAVLEMKQRAELQRAYTQLFGKE